MSGRDRFRRLRPVLRLITAGLRLLPRWLCLALWPLVRSLPWSLGYGLRYCFFCRLSAACGEVLQAGPGLSVRGWEGLRIGDRVSLQDGCYIDASGGISLGDDVSVAHHSSLLSSEHQFELADLAIKYNPMRFAAVEIGPDCWIGCGVRVLAGARLGRRSVIAAGAVLTRGDHVSGLYAGVPARLKRAGPL